MAGHDRFGETVKNPIYVVSLLQSYQGRVGGAALNQRNNAGPIRIQINKLSAANINFHIYQQTPETPQIYRLYINKYKVKRSFNFT